MCEFATSYGLNCVKMILYTPQPWITRRVPFWHAKKCITASYMRENMVNVAVAVISDFRML